ncbi:hypothetical protein [Rhizobium sp. RU36D]|uniref:hypothetical protein n=1 Tax=Rhizobium sp. RU36D TaxID=1907415 RepID=UPI0009D79CDE|nr:hypothetical protein [Rhizobium sp. RU36D]SMD18254.1 hypothetical protein SAMN05880593_13451 [Rhizobium sp. RU36D]
MSIVRHEGRMQVTCDSCPATYRRTYKVEDFDVLIADITSEEWKKFKQEGQWRHRCPDCSKSVERRLV